MKLRLYSYGALAALLLITQQGALLHAFAHAPSNIPPHERQLPHSKVCDKCLAYAGISGALHSDYPNIPSDGASGGIFVSIAWSVHSLSFFAFSSRAPPVFL